MKQVKPGSVVPLVRNLGLFFLAILLIFLAVLAGQFPDRDHPYIPAFSSRYYSEKGRIVTEVLADRMDSQILKTILKTELPVLALAEENNRLLPAGPLLFKPGLHYLAGIKLDEPLTCLKAEIPMLDVIPAAAANLDETGITGITEPPAGPASGRAVPQPAIDNKIKSARPLIALYNTHSSETYELTDGLPHLKGKAGGVTIVAGEIRKVIEERYGIAVTCSSTLHDLAFNKSYAESQKTVSQLLTDNPKLAMLFDIHRDSSLTREQSLTEINGQTTAKILIVVGTNARAEHPDWKENLELAKSIAARMDLMYPGLSRGIAIKQGRYNQQLSPHALLVEIGSVKNSTGEAVTAGRLFADVLVAVLNDLMAAGRLTN